VGADHFYALARDGYFDCAAFYKVTASYAQTGIAATSSATTKWADFIADDEVTVARLSNAQYTLSYVPLDGYGTRSTQFMIHLVDNSYLDAYSYYPFAEVVDGFDTLAAFTTKTFALSDDEETLYEEGGNEWLFSAYSEDNVTLIRSLTAPGSSGSGSQDRSGSWAFGTIMVLLSSAVCIYGGLYIYRFVRKQQGYDTMSSDSVSGSTDRIITLNGEV
jgi:cyclophilin family peptidyl-prolyl cis-trans isomerase